MTNLNQDLTKPRFACFKKMVIHDVLYENMTKKLQWICAISPLITFVILISLAIHCRVGLGHWPEPMYESYSTSIFEMHMKFLDYMYIFSIRWAIVVYLIITAINYKKFDIKRCGIQVGAYFLSWGIVIILLALDKTEFINWLLD